MNSIKFKCIDCNIDFLVHYKKPPVKPRSIDRRCKKCLKNNPNKKHFSEEHRQKLRMANLGKKYSKETNDKKASFGKNNPMHGKSFYDVWLEKYGKDEADRLLKLKKTRNSIASSGKNNPMYGKPSPQGSGNGWSGWYKEYYFRSILELSFIINYIERFNFTVKQTESDTYKIPYVSYDGKERNYYPDFLLNNKYLVEIKPKKLIDGSNLVRLKANAANEFCKNNGLIYKLIHPKKVLSYSEIDELYISGKIKFTEKYKEKYLKLREKIKNEKNKSKNI